MASIKRPPSAPPLPALRRRGVNSLQESPSSSAQRLGGRASLERDRGGVGRHLPEVHWGLAVQGVPPGRRRGGARRRLARGRGGGGGGRVGGWGG